MAKQKRKSKILLISIVGVILTIGLVLGGIWLYNRNLTYGFEEELSEDEKALRTGLITAAEEWLGCNEADGTHKAVIDLYNSHEPLAQGYQVQYDDEWCATFVSAAAIRAGLTQIIPTECGCERQIGLFEQLDCWQEEDDYKPLPGDIIYYSRSSSAFTGDCTAWSDHVGIVVGTNGNRIKVIEGNYGERVDYRYIQVNDSIIRGYATPDYSVLTES